MSQISNLTPSSSFASSLSFEDCPQMTTAIDELHQVNSTIRVSRQLCPIVLGTTVQNTTQLLNYLCIKLKQLTCSKIILRKMQNNSSYELGLFAIARQLNKNFMFISLRTKLYNKVAYKVVQQTHQPPNKTKLHMSHMIRVIQYELTNSFIQIQFSIILLKIGNSTKFC